MAVGDRVVRHDGIQIRGDGGGVAQMTKDVTSIGIGIEKDNIGLLHCLGPWVVESFADVSHLYIVFRKKVEEDTFLLSDLGFVLGRVEFLPCIFLGSNGAGG